MWRNRDTPGGSALVVLNEIEQEVSEAQKLPGNRCRTCTWLLALDKATRAKWDRIFWDGKDADGNLIQNKVWHTQAIQRVIVNKQPEGADFPKSSVENHRKHQHPTPTE